MMSSRLTCSHHLRTLYCQTWYADQRIALASHVPWWLGPTAPSPKALLHRSFGSGSNASYSGCKPRDNDLAVPALQPANLLVSSLPSAALCHTVPLLSADSCRYSLIHRAAASSCLLQLFRAAALCYCLPLLFAVQCRKYLLFPAPALHGVFYSSVCTLLGTPRSRCLSSSLLSLVPPACCRCTDLVVSHPHPLMKVLKWSLSTNFYHYIHNSWWWS